MPQSPEIAARHGTAEAAVSRMFRAGCVRPAPCYTRVMRLYGAEMCYCLRVGGAAPRALLMVVLYHRARRSPASRRRSAIMEAYRRAVWLYHVIGAGSGTSCIARSGRCHLTTLQQAI